MKKKKGERRWNRWTDKKTRRAFPNRPPAGAPCAVRVYWLREEKV